MESPDTPHKIEFPRFFAELKQGKDLPEIISVGEKEQTQIEDWIWEHLFKKNHLGEEGAWIYDHMEKTSKVLEAAGINTHNFEHVKTVMVNACLIFLITQGLYLKEKYDLTTDLGQTVLLEKLFIIAISALFHDTGYLNCIADENNFTKKDLDDHAYIGGKVVYSYGDETIGKLLRRTKKEGNKKDSLEVFNKLLNTFFQPDVSDIINNMEKNTFYKNLRKIRAAITSHDSPDQQGGTDESAKTSSLPAEAAAVYLADKTHIGNRVRGSQDCETEDIINNQDISILHDRLTYLIKEESFAIEYGKEETQLRINLVVHIPQTYQNSGYNSDKFKEEFKRGFEKRYTHAQKVFGSLMHREYLNNNPNTFVVEANIDGVMITILKISEPPVDPRVGSLLMQMTLGAIEQ